MYFLSTYNRNIDGQERATCLRDSSDGRPILIKKIKLLIAERSEKFVYSLSLSFSFSAPLPFRFLLTIRTKQAWPLNAPLTSGGSSP